MRKSKSMRLASGLLVVTMLSTCMISGTFAKYTTSVNSSDSARVAKWGWTQSSIDLSGLFNATAETGTAVSNSENIIAPGTEGSATFDFTFGGEGTIAPEVAYTFLVDASTNTCDSFIKANKNIKWYLDDASKSAPLTWDGLIAAINDLDGENGTNAGTYAPNQLPDKFNQVGSNIHTISWKWDFQETDTAAPMYWVKNDGSEILDSNPSGTEYTAMTQNQYDTYMGNMTELDDVSIKITITATQIN